MKYDIDAIQKVKNFIPQHELDIIHNFLLSQKKFKVKDVMYVDQIVGEYENDSPIEDQQVISLMRDINQRIVEYITNHYFEKIGLKVTKHTWTRNLELIRWSHSASLGPHADGLSTEPPMPRHNIGALVYINDNYEGGEINFPDFNVKIKPSSGDLVMFPCHYIHEVCEIGPRNDESVVRHTMPVFYNFDVQEI